ncbi:MAG: trypsin-like peptidase domain-containing protein [Gemmatimonadetes bacterium]|nr:trypsin-like peptidase domain-containing protein [Gemmatimonadota bacterium]
MPRWVVVLGIGCLLGPDMLAAQQTRNERLAAAQRAYEEFDTDQALTLLRAALNPAEGPQDSAWARGVELLGQILLEAGDTLQARVWFRWAFRTAPTIPIDTVNFLADVVQAMRGARAAVTASPGDLVSRTTWQWAAPGAPPGQGRLQLTAPRMTAPVNALVPGAGVVQSGQTVALAAATYEIQTAAEGYLTTQLTREVLPGVTTVLEFNLSPLSAGVLASNVRAAAFARLVPLTVRRFPSDSTCATGALVGGAGLVLTSYTAIRGAERVGAVVGSRRFGEEIRVLAWDVARNLAVLQVPVGGADSLPLASQVGPGQFVWALGFPNCQTPLDTRARAGATVEPALELADSVRDAERLGPLINSDGQLVGIVTAARAGAPPAAVQAVLDAARRQVSAREKLTVAQVALRENHAYGSMAISADVTGVTARITTLETWQWPQLAWSGPLPRTFTGPMGRYQLDVQFPGQESRRLQFTIRAGATERFPVATRALAAEEPQVGVAPPRRGKKFPWPIALIGAGGLGAAAFLLFGGGGGTDTGGMTVLLPSH